MPEDQSYNGDVWNDQAATLLTKFNWIPLGDSNVDLPNDEGKKSGVDRLFTYIDSLRVETTEAVLVEAKRYKSTNFSASSLQTWIRTVDNKLNTLKSSGDLQEKLPVLADVRFRTGVIVVWFHDVDEFYKFRETLTSYKANVKLTRKAQPSNKIYVLDNEIILRLASMYEQIEQLNSKFDNRFRFYYPSVDLHPVKRSSVLNLNYMVSKFILGDFSDENGVENRVVFYFGNLALEDFQRLKHALVSFSYIDDDKPLILYTYQRDDEEFRKIKGELPSLFKTKIDLKEMELYIHLPTFMR